MNLGSLLSSLIGALIGGGFALLGVWRTHRHAQTRQDQERLASGYHDVLRQLVRATSTRSSFVVNQFDGMGHDDAPAYYERLGEAYAALLVLRTLCGTDQLHRIDYAKDLVNGVLRGTVPKDQPDLRAFALQDVSAAFDQVLECAGEELTTRSGPHINPPPDQA